MVFSSIYFLCLFLPAVLMLYFIIPGKFRNILLLIASLIFYGWGEPVYIWLMVFSIAVNYICGLLIDGSENRAKRLTLLIVCLIADLGILGFFKYTDFAIENINKISGSSIVLLKLALPVGISFYTFQTLSYVIDIYRGNVRAQRNIIDFGMYICMFPQLIAGPIVRYTDVEGQLKKRVVDENAVWSGLVRFSAGLFKKVMFANQVGLIWSGISALTTRPAATAWLGAICFTFQIYFDFSGYSDMAIGLGKIFGFNFPENFRYPYEADSITEFWRRWHITLSTWFREYLYIPLGGNRCSVIRQILNLLIVWALTGIWHGAGWNFLLWGLYYFLLLTLEKFVFKNILKRTPAVLRHVYALILTVFGWVIFACDDINVLSDYVGTLFGSQGMANSMSAYYLLTNSLLLIVMALASTHYPKAIIRKIFAKLDEKQTYIFEFLFVLGCVGLSIIFLIGDTYNPFLYFRF